MQRFYTPNTQFGEKLTLSDKEVYHQLTRVLRSRAGDEVIFFDGKTQEDYVYKIEEISKNSITFSLKKVQEKNSELDFSLTLFQAIPNKLEKLEYIVQKCSEVGFSKIVFFPSERSQKLILNENKKARLQKIMQEAIEQCGRNRLCRLEFLLQNIVIPAKAGIDKNIKVPYLFGGFLPSQEGRDTFNIVFHQELSEDSNLIKDIVIKKGQNVCVFVGPEGGFSESEIETFEKQNIEKVYLGERILRCETAGAVTGFFLGQNR